MRSKRRLLVLAQTPPPYNGQIIMLQQLLNYKWDDRNIELIHIPLKFSNHVNAIGKFSFFKILLLVELLFRILSERLKGKIDYLYLPPAVNKMGFYRDVIILVLSKFIANKRVIHCHAGGIDAFFNKLNWFEKNLAKGAYNKIDLVIVLLPSLRREVNWMNPKHLIVIPNQIDLPVYKKAKNKIPQLLFCSNFIREKGYWDVLLAAKESVKINIHFKLNMVGEWYDEMEKSKVLEFIKKNKLSNTIFIHNAKYNEEKYKTLNNSDIFLFPSYDNEAMPLCLLEAMHYNLHIVAYKWRTNEEVLSNYYNKTIVEFRNINELKNTIIKQVQRHENI